MYNIVYRISLFIAFQYILPTLALVYLNTRVIVALRRSDSYRQSTARRYPAVAAQHGAQDAVTQSTRSITVVVAVIVVICIVVHVVALTAHAVATIQVSRYTNYFIQISVDAKRLCIHHLVVAMN